MSTRPPGYFSKLAGRIGGLLRRQAELPPVPRQVAFDPYQDVLRRTRPTPQRSQYEVPHRRGSLSYAEHDAHVRSAMETEVDRPSWMVWHGWRDKRLPHEEN